MISYPPQSTHSSLYLCTILGFAEIFHLEKKSFEKNVKKNEDMLFKNDDKGTEFLPQTQWLQAVVDL